MQGVHRHGSPAGDGRFDGEGCPDNGGVLLGRLFVVF